MTTAAVHSVTNGSFMATCIDSTDHSKEGSQLPLKSTSISETLAITKNGSTPMVKQEEELPSLNLSTDGSISSPAQTTALAASTSTSHFMCHRQLQQTFSKLVKQAGVQSTAAIFAAVSTCWESLECLEDTCPTWAVYTGTTSIANRIFHRCQLQSSSSLVQLFSYYALLNEVQIAFSDPAGKNHLQTKVLDALILLDAMRSHSESATRAVSKSFLSPGNSSPSTAVDSDCVSTASDSSGVSRLMSEDEDETNKAKLRIMVSCTTACTAKTTQFKESYVPMRLNELKKAIKLNASAVQRHQVSKEIAAAKFSSPEFETKTEIVDSEMFEKAMTELLTVGESVRLNPSKIGTVAVAEKEGENSLIASASVHTPQPTDGMPPTETVSELVEFLDQIREALEVPNTIQSETEKSLENSSSHSPSSGSPESLHHTSDVVLRLLEGDQSVTSDKDALAWIELANCLSEASVETSPVNTEFSSPPKTKRRSNNLSPSSQSRARKRRKTNSPGNTASPSDQPSIAPNQQLPLIAGEHLAYSEADLATPCPGVCWDPTHMRWVAHWSDARSHQRIRKYFNPKLLGFERARLLAILTRKEAVDSGRASMMVKADRPKMIAAAGIAVKDINIQQSSTATVIPSDDPFDRNYVKGVYYSPADKCWYSHFKLQEAAEIQVEGFPVADFLEDAKGDDNIAMAAARTKAIECRQNAMVTMRESQPQPPPPSPLQPVVNQSSQSDLQQLQRSPINITPMSGVVVVSGRTPPSHPPISSVTLPPNTPIVTSTIKPPTIKSPPHNSVASDKPSGRHQITIQSSLPGPKLPSTGMLPLVGASPRVPCAVTPSLSQPSIDATQTSFWVTFPTSSSNTLTQPPSVHQPHP